MSRSEQRFDAVGMMRSHRDRMSAEIEDTTPEAQKAWMARRTVEDPLSDRPEVTAGGEETFWAGVEEAGRFFMGEADVQRAMERLARKLDELGIPYAVIGAMALNEWGYRRVTVDVDVLLTPEGFSRLKGEVVGRGYVERPVLLRVSTNDPTGVVVGFSIRAPWVRAVAVQAADDAAPAGARIFVAKFRKGVEKRDVRLRVRLQLAPGAIAGHRAWPLAVVLSPA